jgi:hypothetical protein
MIVGNRGNIEHGGRAVTNSAWVLPTCIAAGEFVTSLSNRSSAAQFAGRRADISRSIAARPI